MPPGSSKADAMHPNEESLVPPPTNDPADPLNWSIWRKTAITFFITAFAFISNFWLSVLGPVLPFLIPAFGTPLSSSKLSPIIAGATLTAAASSIWWVPLANTYGRRPVLLVSTLLSLACCIWGARAESYNSLLAARIVTGAFIGSSETVCPDIVGEIFLYHRRGRIMTIYTFGLAGGSTVGGLAGGYIAANLGWRWSIWLPAIGFGLLTIFCFLAMPETLYNRELTLPVIEVTEEQKEAVKSTQTDGNEANEHVENISFTPYTFSRSVKVFAIYRPGLTQRMVQPWLSLRFPVVIVVCLVYAGLTGGLISASTVGPTLLAMPPYSWGQNVSLFSVGAVIGIVAGVLYSLSLSDWVVARAAKKHSSGTIEPESRLPMVMPALFLATMGMLTFGLCGQNPGESRWVGMEAGIAMIAFGVTVSPSVLYSYIIDTHYDVSGDAFTMAAVARGIVSFAFTWFVSDWVESRGAAEPFEVFTAVMGFFSLMTVGLYFYGKRFRIATASWLAGYQAH
ncbi:hypothetical protein ZTR_09856 [Talaromyces verruculosus]|nr:hypothetical protein ZTR_09856 [Talaromyces verruculosus]